MAARFHAEGNAVDYTPAAAVAAGEGVKLGSIIGIAANDIPANKKGALRVNGIFRADTPGFGAVVPQAIANAVDFDFGSQTVVPDGSGDAQVQLYVAEPITDGTATEVQVWINQVGG